MEFPKMTKNSRSQITVKGFDGGVNCSEAAWRVGDRQLTDALNLWWSKRALSTRPGIKALPDTFFSIAGKTAVSASGGRIDLSSANGVRRKLARIYRRTSGGSTLYDAVLSIVDYKGGEQRSTIRAGMSAAECAGIMLAESGGGSWSGTVKNCSVAFIGQGGSAFGGQILAEPALPDSPWVDIAAQAYIPLVMINGLGSETTESAKSPGTIYEGYNLLTPKFRAHFTTTGESGRFFFLPVKQLDNSEVAVRYTEQDGSVYTYTIPAGASASQPDSDGISVHVNRAGGYIYCVQTELNTVRWFPASGISNNLEVTASKTRGQGRDKICSMRICTWFGGDRSGYNGGTRLFVSGHPLYPNLVYWSDVNNPLYFPENNYAFLGDSGQAVTAFAKQGEKLVIFKEREMYYAAYTSGSRSAQYLPDGSVVDATANSARFPVAQLHPFIGCDCPGTIQLCDNRLVWADSGGRVYVLAAENQYSESNVRVISGSVSRLLSRKAGPELISACSGDYMEHYVLLAGNEMFLFNYTDSNYAAYLQSSSKSPMQSLIPWMRWSFDCGFSPFFMMANGGQMVIGGLSADNGTVNAVLNDGGDDERLVTADAGKTTESLPVEYMLQTRLYDFGQPQRRKDVLQLYLELEGARNATTAVYMDETGDLSSAVPVKVFDPAGITRLAPNAVRVRLFGLRLQGRGAVSIGGMTVNYRIYGKGIR